MAVKGHEGISLGGCPGGRTVEALPVFGGWVSCDQKDGVRVAVVASLHRKGNDQLWAGRQTRRYFCYAVGLAFCIALEAICMYMTSHALWQYLWVMAEGNQGGGGQPQTLCPSPDLAPEHSTDNTVSTCGLSSAGRRHGWGPKSQR
jgi:hypothetical protein